MITLGKFTLIFLANKFKWILFSKIIFTPCAITRATNFLPCQVFEWQIGEKSRRHAVAEIWNALRSNSVGCVVYGPIVANIFITWNMRDAFGALNYFLIWTLLGGFIIRVMFLQKVCNLWKNYVTWSIFSFHVYLCVLAFTSCKSLMHISFFFSDCHGKKEEWKEIVIIIIECKTFFVI